MFRCKVCLEEFETEDEYGKHLLETEEDAEAHAADRPQDQT